MTGKLQNLGDSLLLETNLRCLLVHAVLYCQKVVGLTLDSSHPIKSRILIRNYKVWLSIRPRYNTYLR